MLQHGNTVFLTIRSFDMAKFTSLTTFSLITSCELTFLTVGLKISFLPTFAFEISLKEFRVVRRELIRYTL
jgi:hypothetical protein